jgi:protoheme ferro-lyase
VQIKEDGITRLVVLPLYPQFSISTSGSSLRLLESIFRYGEYFYGRHRVFALTVLVTFPICAMCQPHLLGCNI